MEANTQVCRRCRRFFTYVGYGYMYCQHCKKKDEEDFNKVRDYIYANGTATIMQVVAETGVEQPYVKQFLREGRLIIPESSPIFIKCESCGCDIRSGRYCTDCGARLSKELKSAAILHEMGEKPKGQMHYLNSKEKDSGSLSRSRNSLK